MWFRRYVKQLFRATDKRIKLRENFGVLFLPFLSHPAASHNRKGLQRQRQIFKHQRAEGSRPRLFRVLGNGKHSDANGDKHPAQRTQRRSFGRAGENPQRSTLLRRLHRHACGNQNRPHQQRLHSLQRLHTRLQPGEQRADEQYEPQEPLDSIFRTQSINHHTNYDERRHRSLQFRTQSRAAPGQRPTVNSSKHNAKWDYE